MMDYNKCKCYIFSLSSFDVIIVVFYRCPDSRRRPVEHGELDN